MIQKINKEVITLNNDPGVYQYLTDEEDEQLIRNTYFAQGEEAGIEQGKAVGIVEGKSIGIAEGRISGIEEEKRSNAKKMRLENIPLDVIKKITGLDINIIKNL